MTDTNGWLPQDYKEPVTSNYMNFEEGSNLFRILGKFSDGTAIMGFEYWKTLTVDGKPKRSPIRVKQDVVINSDEIELNPKTGQPDFAEIKIDYIPDARCVELKSLKLYYWSFRDEGHFHEQVTNMIANDLIKLLDPRRIKVTAVFNVRGGVHTTVEVEHSK